MKKMRKIMFFLVVNLDVKLQMYI